VRTDDAVAHAWSRLVAWGYRPELITARETLRMVPLDVDREAFRIAWDAKGAEALRAKAIHMEKGLV
jgi:hypothetical protein